MQRMVFIMHLL